MIAADLTVLRVNKSAIEQLGAVVSDYFWSDPWDRFRAEGVPKC